MTNLGDNKQTDVLKEGEINQLTKDGKYPKVDTWVRGKDETPYVYQDGDKMRMNIAQYIPESFKEFSDKDKEAQIALQTFVIERSLYAKKLDILCRYIDYFIEFFDTKKELPVLFINMKNSLDSRNESLTKSEFVTLLLRRFFKNTKLKKAIFEMVEANYDYDITVDAKSGRSFTGIYDFTNEEAIALLSISMFMKIMIPIISEYCSTNTLYDSNELTQLVTNIFIRSFYFMGTTKTLDAEDLLTKLHKFTEDKILKHLGANGPLWQQQCALRGLTESKHVDTILIKHLLSNNMFKFVFKYNLVSFLKSIVETQLGCTINKVKYKKDPVRIDSKKDFSGLSGADKLAQSMAKMDESQIIHCEKSINDVIGRLLEEDPDPVTQEELDYYNNNFFLSSTYHDMLFGYYYANLFGGFIEIKNLTIEERLKMLVLGKRKMIRQGYTQLPHLFTSVIEGRTSMRTLQNIKFINKLTSSELYQKLLNEKYSALIGFNDHEEDINKLISRALNNTYAYVDFNNQELTGTVIEFDEDIISNEILTMVDMI